MNTYLEFCVQKMAEKAKVDIKDIPLKQLKMGVDIEREHTGKMGKDTKVIDSDEGALLMRVEPKHFGLKEVLSKAGTTIQQLARQFQSQYFMF